jgi:hypothetical protein
MSLLPESRAVRVVTIVAFLFLAGCAAGNVKFTAEDPAGFFMGFWHGLILLFSFIVSLFNDNVLVYETANSGHIYDLGFLLGVVCFSGGGVKVHRTKKVRRKDGARLEERIKVAVKSCLDESGEVDPEWQEIAEKVKEKIKREIRAWAEKEK